MPSQYVTGIQTIGYLVWMAKEFCSYSYKELFKLQEMEGVGKKLTYN